jgi:site-specific DNA-cytosine methylase
MNVLIACEFSGAVRREFTQLGHNAMSCDLLPAEDGGYHYRGDVREVLSSDWDLMIAFPPCTHLCSSGSRWWAAKQTQQQEALSFVRLLMSAPVRRIALENPVGKISSAVRRPDQIIQPWQFNEGYVKTTCLWLKNLPRLRPTRIVPGREQKCWKMPPSPTRSQDRSRTYAGIAQAMARQWGRQSF